MTPATTIISLGPRGAAFLGVAGLAVPITTGLKASTDPHQVIIRRAVIGGTQSPNPKFGGQGCTGRAWASL
jgi:hypothetical protein